MKSYGMFTTLLLNAIFTSFPFDHSPDFPLFFGYTVYRFFNVTNRISIQNIIIIFVSDTITFFVLYHFLKRLLRHLLKDVEGLYVYFYADSFDYKSFF